MEQNKIIDLINEKYKTLGENPDTYLKGVVQAKPVNYWDYVAVDTLLSLQRPRTDFKDEEIFIMYHQVTELVLKMMLHEIRQLSETEEIIEKTWIDKLGRINRYTLMLITSFDIMKKGMSYEDYNTFRTALAPASGFQSVQFRHVELFCTRLENLVNESGKQRLAGDNSVESMFDNLYWKDAGYNRETGKKTLTLRQFEERYQEGLISLTKKLSGRTLEERFLSMGSPSEELKEKLREFDHLYNVAWPMVHLNTARHYLDSKGENKAATGGSEWKKYLHPAFQQRKFFPSLWTSEEIESWGKKETAEV